MCVLLQFHLKRLKLEINDYIIGSKILVKSRLNACGQHLLIWLIIYNVPTRLQIFRRNRYRNKYLMIYDENWLRSVFLLTICMYVIRVDLSTSRNPYPPIDKIADWMADKNLEDVESPWDRCRDDCDPCFFLKDNNQLISNVCCANKWIKQYIRSLKNFNSFEPKKFHRWKINQETSDSFFFLKSIVLYYLKLKKIVFWNCTLFIISANYANNYI